MAQGSHQRPMLLLFLHPVILNFFLLFSSYLLLKYPDDCCIFRNHIHVPDWERKKVKRQATEDKRVSEIQCYLRSTAHQTSTFISLARSMTHHIPSSQKVARENGVVGDTGSASLLCLP